MAITSVLTPDPSTILNNILNTISAGLVQLGISNPQLDPSSDFYIIATALSNQLSIISQNLNTIALAVMPDTATGDDLTRYAAIFGVDRKSASPSNGFVLANCSANSYVAAGTQLTSSGGLAFQVSVGSQLILGDSPLTNLVQVESIDTGSQTNLLQNASLTWIGTPAFTQSIAIANPSPTFSQGFSGGNDAETDASLRQRLLNTLRSPPMYGNWQQIAQTAEEASPFIEHVFVYPCANGPGTQGVVLTAAQTPSNIVNRGVDTRSLGWQDGYAAINSNAPGYVQTIVPFATFTDGYNYSVNNVSCDISLGLNLPFPIGASFNGFGGGWVNYGVGQGIGPFPNPVPNGAVIDSNGNSIRAALISQITPAGFVIYINAYAPNDLADPSLVASISQISWISNQTSQGNGWVLITSTVAAFTFTSAGAGSLYGTYQLTLNSPLIYVDQLTQLASAPQVGDYIMPAMINGQSYLDSIMASFAQLGPGQINNLQVLFPNSYRQPVAIAENTDIVGTQFLQNLVTQNSEVTSASYYYNYSLSAEPPIPNFTNPSAPYYTASGNLTQGPGNAPSVWVPRQIGFYGIGL